MGQKFYSAEEIGKRIRKAISEQCMSEDDLAKITGLNYTTIIRFISGTRVPSGTALYKIATATHHTMEFFITGERYALYGKEGLTPKHIVDDFT